LGLIESIRSVFNPIKKDQRHEQRQLNIVPAYGGAVVVDSDKALTFTAVWSAIKLLSEAVSSLPMGVFTDDDGNKYPDTSNPLYNIIKYKPNNYQSRSTFLEKIMMDILTNGNSYVFIERNGAGKVTQLLPLNFDDVTITTKDGYLFYETKNGFFDSSDILHFKTLSQDGIVGLSPIDQCKNAIGWGMAVEEFGNTFFKSGAKLSGVLQTDRALSETAIDRLRNSFNNVYSSLSGANQTAILEEGLTFKPVSINPDQAQFLASRTFSIEEVGRIFRVAPHLLYDLSKSSFNNVEMQSQEFLTFSLLPYLIKIEQEMNLKLFTSNELGKTFIEFNVNGLLRGNVKDRSDYYRTMINIGAMSINEVRRKENMNKIEDGDKHFMQMNMTTIEKIGEDAAADS
tara:strand:- start:232 stop:1428 length:1197 start_codon:yes stop_codon:yes gene_type:complete